MSALIYQPNNKWRFATALTAAAVIHVAAISFATTQPEAPAVPRTPREPPEISFERDDPIPDPQTDEPEPAATPPTIDESYVEDTATPPPVRRPPQRFVPPLKPRSSAAPNSQGRPGTTALALNAPRPEYPFEARRQKITGDGVVVMSVDPGTGNVIGVSMAKSTGNAFLDNAALAGFRRWRFKPGGASTVTCPVTFTLSGVSL